MQQPLPISEITTAFESVDEIKSALLHFFPIRVESHEHVPTATIRLDLDYGEIICSMSFDGWFDHQQERRFYPVPDHVCCQSEGGPHLSIWFTSLEGGRLDYPSWVYKYGGEPPWLPVWEHRANVKNKSSTEIALDCIQAMEAMAPGVIPTRQLIHDVLIAASKDGKIVEEQSDGLGSTRILRAGGKRFESPKVGRIINALHTQELIARIPMVPGRPQNYSVTQYGKQLADKLQK